MPTMKALLKTNLAFCGKGIELFSEVLCESQVIQVLKTTVSDARASYIHVSLCAFIHAQAILQKPLNWQKITGTIVCFQMME